MKYEKSNELNTVDGECKMKIYTGANEFMNSPKYVEFGHFDLVAVAVKVSLNSLTENSKEATAIQTYLVNIYFYRFCRSCAREQFMLAMWLIAAKAW